MRSHRFISATFFMLSCSLLEHEAVASKVASQEHETTHRLSRNRRVFQSPPLDQAFTEAYESMDEEMTLKMEQDGRKMLLGISLPSKLKNYERIVKLGDPAKKISELASSINADTIVMGRKGLSDTDSNLGHVTTKVLSLTSKPVVLV